ncbi:hypothetical protein [Pedobacter sp. Leaf176]|uniref:hypothetical protein n=1 Tax=Pedobacter sp. Leaf176 TaxID=1736286 RepID=UPI0007157555|nr:hypothetical protein [Pedobacter sp. Leaf176]KQR65319.1 hypothetical protein ASF92_20530 [Pedobacter sp. Leaf176]
MMNKLLRLQGVFYLFTGVWPIIHIQSFMWVTGPKIDIWLVKMVGLLSIAISLSILSQPAHKQRSPVLSISTAISFLAIDVYYTTVGTISKIYLADAVIQLIFIILACLATDKGKKSKFQL